MPITLRCPRPPSARPRREPKTPTTTCARRSSTSSAISSTLELGANVLVQFDGPCRLGYYGELQESILRDMGYEFDMLNFSAGIEEGAIGWAKPVSYTHLTLPTIA